LSQVEPGDRDGSAMVCAWIWRSACRGILGVQSATMLSVVCITFRFASRECVVDFSLGCLDEISEVIAEDSALFDVEALKNFLVDIVSSCSCFPQGPLQCCYQLLSY